MFYYKQQIGSSQLAIWRIDETKDQLLSMLDRKDWLNNFMNIRSESRILEILAVRVLIKELLGEEKKIEYLPSGRPVLADQSYYIGISHTRKYVSVVLNSNYSVALDMEHISDRVRRVRSRLVSDAEYIDEQQDLIHLLLHWSTKEAIFKYIDMEAVDFRKHLRVDHFTPQSFGNFTARESRTDNVHQFQVYYWLMEDFVLVYILSEQDYLSEIDSLNKD